MIDKRLTVTNKTDGGGTATKRIPDRSGAKRSSGNAQKKQRNTLSASSSTSTRKRQANTMEAHRKQMASSGRNISDAVYRGNGNEKPTTLPYTGGKPTLIRAKKKDY
jgi:hypothetical protein